MLGKICSSPKLRRTGPSGNLGLHLGSTSGFIVFPALPEVPTPAFAPDDTEVDDFLFSVPFNSSFSSSPGRLRKFLFFFVNIGNRSRITRLSVFEPLRNHYDRVVLTGYKHAAYRLGELHSDDASRLI